MDIRSIFSRQTIITLALAAVSAVLSGLLIWLDTPLWYGIYANPIPGIVFGLLFSIANVGRRSGLAAVGRVVIYVIGSAVFYMAAVLIYIGILMVNMSSAGFVAGGFGAVCLALLTKLISGTPLKALDEIRTTVIGSVAGVVFVSLFIPSQYATGTTSLPFLIGVLAFAVWQIPAAWSLTVSIQKSPAVPDDLPARESV